MWTKRSNGRESLLELGRGKAWIRSKAAQRQRQRVGFLMSEQQKMIEVVDQQAQQHAEGILRQRIGTLLTAEAQRVLELHYHPEHRALVIGCLDVPCWLQLAPDGSGFWAFGCPWWQVLISEELFEARVLIEVGKVKMHIDGVLEKLDPARVN
jgi:hypothetical protein